MVPGLPTCNNITNSSHSREYGERVSWSWRAICGSHHAALSLFCAATGKEQNERCFGLYPERRRWAVDMLNCCACSSAARA